DSLVAQYIVGDGKVVGVEAHPVVAFIVREGMQHYDLNELPIARPMRDIEVVHAEAVNYLKTLDDNSFDVVFMDPMFDEVIEESSNFTALRDAGAHISLSKQWVDEALRVAKRGVVLKAHFRSPLFNQFGFKQDVRPTSKFHYGFLAK
ncbi:MAG: class I SAM-dependent methyltransferase, partial [Lysinibacillus sp.]